MSEKEEKLDEVIDLEEVKKNEGTTLGRTAVAQIARETALRDTQDVVKADQINEKLEKVAKQEKAQEQVEAMKESDELEK